ncbi:TPA: hypothetical protein ROY17_005529 [Bacillus thuringiensis]|nr:hypothetical protein [Bacillus thuringiensis]
MNLQVTVHTRPNKKKSYGKNDTPINGYEIFSCMGSFTFKKEKNVLKKPLLVVKVPMETEM